MIDPDPGTIVIYNGLTMTLLEHDGKTAVCQWRFRGKLKADLFRLKDLRLGRDHSAHKITNEGN